METGQSRVGLDCISCVTKWFQRDAQTSIVLAGASQVNFQCTTVEPNDDKQQVCTHL